VHSWRGFRLAKIKDSTAMMTFQRARTLIIADPTSDALTLRARVAVRA
jgi:hypothetical protein